MANIISNVAGMDGDILIAEERVALRYAFRVIDPRHVCVVDIDTATISEAYALSSFETWLTTHGRTRWRAYRTNAGVRLIEVSNLWWPRTHVVKELMQALHADPAYVDGFVLAFKPGSESGTFSARIDPKPWNMDGGPTREELIAMTDAEYTAYRAVYASAKGAYRTAQFLDSYGETGLPIHPWAQLVVAYHDSQARVTSTDPLA